MLIIRCNTNHPKERQYIYDVVFKDFWNLDYHIIYEKRKNLAIECNNTTILLSDVFFQFDELLWLNPRTLPVQPLNCVNVEDPFLNAVVDIKLPIIYGDKNNKECIFDKRNKYCFIDIFGSAFFMLTRYEEVVKKDRDLYDRFPARASLAYQEKFLERPIINEYLEILWILLKSHFPNINRRKRNFKIMPTHDVDNPFWSLTLHGFPKYRSLLGDIVKRHNPALLLRNLRLYRDAAFGNFTHDPYNTFDTIMDISECNGLVSSFYFMTSQNRNIKDGNYDVLSRPIIDLAQKIIKRGHYIGIHPGFGSYKEMSWIQDDVNRLHKMILQGNLLICRFGGRQHFLLWKAPETWQYYEQAGLSYDTTLSYADHIGFRCGICYDYPVYNIITHEQYKLREYPLEVMECSGLDERYMGLTHDAMKERCIAIKRMCQKYRGIFVILWHNTRFLDRLEVKLYNEILET